MAAPVGTVLSLELPPKLFLIERTSVVYGMAHFGDRIDILRSYSLFRNDVNDIFREKIASSRVLAVETASTVARPPQNIKCKTSRSRATLKIIGSAERMSPRSSMKRGIGVARLPLRRLRVRLFCSVH